MKIVCRKTNVINPTYPPGDDNEVLLLPGGVVVGFRLSGIPVGRGVDEAGVGQGVGLLVSVPIDSLTQNVL